MTKEYHIHCECQSVKAVLRGKPKVKGICHCEDCRTLLDLPFHSVTAWNKEQLEVTEGKAVVSEYQHPKLRMKRIYCSSCGETLYNTNAMDWRVVSQYLIRKCNDNVLPKELLPISHFFYARRLFDIDDELPKRE